MKNRKSIGWAVILVVAAIACAGWLMWPSSEASRNNPKALKHFRVVASYVYRGEPVEFDVVAECRYWTDGYIAESISRGFRVPYLYGHRMPDGAALFMALPYVCFVNLETDLNAEFMPLTFLAEDADDLSLFTAYTSDAGYTWPDDRLKFESAYVEPATQQQRADWVKLEHENVINVDNDPWQVQRRSRDVPKRTTNCHGVFRLPIPEQLKPAITAAWPSSRPRFWSPQDIQIVADAGGQAAAGIAPADQMFNRGVLRSNGTGRLFPKGKPRYPVPMESIPLTLPWAKPFLRPEYKTSNEAVLTYDIGDGTNTGQSLCYQSTYHFKKILDNYPGEYVEKHRTVHLVDGREQYTRQSGNRFAPMFEGDQFVLWFSLTTGVNAEKGRME